MGVGWYILTNIKGWGGRRRVEWVLGGTSLLTSRDGGGGLKRYFTLSKIKGMVERGLFDSSLPKSWLPSTPHATFTSFRQGTICLPFVTVLTNNNNNHNNNNMYNNNNNNNNILNNQATYE